MKENNLSENVESNSNEKNENDGLLKTNKYVLINDNPSYYDDIYNYLFSLEKILMKKIKLIGKMSYIQNYIKNQI